MFKVNIGYIYGYKYWIHISTYIRFKGLIARQIIRHTKENIFQLNKDSYYFSFIHIHVINTKRGQNVFQCENSALRNEE